MDRRRRHRTAPGPGDEQGKLASLIVPVFLQPGEQPEDEAAAKKAAAEKRRGSLHAVG
jgi:hypothetical protein